MSNLLAGKSPLSDFLTGRQEESTLLIQSGSWEKVKEIETFMGNRDKTVPCVQPVQVPAGRGTVFLSNTSTVVKSDYST